MRLQNKPLLATAYNRARTATFDSRGQTYSVHPQIDQEGDRAQVKRIKRTVVAIFVGMLAMLTSGCGTVLSHRTYPLEKTVYRGVRWNCRDLANLTSWAIDEPAATLICVPVGLLRIVDLPLSFAADTIILPLDLRNPPYRLGRLRAPAVDLTGVWDVDWVDQKRGYTERIVVTIRQAGNAVTGSALDPARVPATVIGEVSGNRFRLLIDPTHGSHFRDPGDASTFAGVVTNSLASGQWYFHGARKMSGPWTAVRVGDIDSKAMEVEPAHGGDRLNAQ